MEKYMTKTKITNFGTAERTQQAYEQVIVKLDRIEGMLYFFCLVMAAGFGFMITDLLLG
jgi:cell division protein FtsL